MNKQEHAERLLRQHKDEFEFSLVHEDDELEGLDYDTVPMRENTEFAIMNTRTGEIYD